MANITSQLSSLCALLLAVALWSSACDNKPPGEQAPAESSQEVVKEARAEATPDAAPGDQSPQETPADDGKPQRCEVREAPDPNNPKPNYSQHNAVLGTHCDGTNHQDIKGVQKVVFVGDSITKGTPPTPVEKYYRNQLTVSLKAKFGDDLEVVDCSAWGARTDDLLLEPHKQLKTCLPDDTEPKVTLIVMTIGGNDMQSIAKKAVDGETLAQSNQRADKALALLKDALLWATDKKRFPNGSFVIMGNVYEFTDGTNDLSSCEAAKAAGLDGTWPDAAKVFIRFNETMMKLAVETKTDMIFMLERFCGHGFKRDDPKNACYRGPNTEAWFDLTCTHPSPAGHTQIARMFMSVVNE